MMVPNLQPTAGGQKPAERNGRTMSARTKVGGGHGTLNVLCTSHWLQSHLNGIGTQPTKVKQSDRRCAAPAEEHTALAGYLVPCPCNHH